LVRWTTPLFFFHRQLSHNACFPLAAVPVQSPQHLAEMGDLRKRVKEPPSSYNDCPSVGSKGFLKRVIMRNDTTHLLISLTFFFFVCLKGLVYAFRGVLPPNSLLVTASWVSSSPNHPVFNIGHHFVLTVALSRRVEISAAGSPLFNQSPHFFHHWTLV